MFDVAFNLAPMDRLSFRAATPRSCERRREGLRKADPVSQTAGIRSEHANNHGPLDLLQTEHLLQFFSLALHNATGCRAVLSPEMESPWNSRHADFRWTSGKYPCRPSPK